MTIRFAFKEGRCQKYWKSRFIQPIKNWVTPVLQRSNPPIILDYTPPLGDGKGYMPLELLLMSLADCSGGSLSLLLKKMGKSVSAVSIHAKGIRRERSPKSFTKFFLEFSLHSRDAEDEDIRKAITLAKDSICAVWDMLKGNVEIVTDYKIIDS